MKKLLLAVVGVFAGLSASAADMTLWSGSQELGWSFVPKITAAQCSSFEEGGNIVVSYEVQAGTDYTSLKVAYEWGNFSWGDATAVPTTSTSKTFGPIAAADLEIMNQKGFGLMGHGLTVSKIEYKSPSGPVDPQQLLRDPVTISTESGSVEFSYDAIVAAGGAVGGGIEVDYTGLEGKGFYVNFMHQGNADNEYTWCEFSNLQIIEETGKSTLVLNQSTMDELNTYKKNLIVQCGFVDISNVRVVLPADMPEIKDEVILDKTELNLQPGETAKLNAVTKPGGATVTWISSAPEVATVDAEGNVTAVAYGTAVITAATEKAKANCTVTIKEPNSIKLNFSEIDFMLGDGSVRVIATTVPADAAVKFEIVDANPEKCVNLYSYKPSSYWPNYNCELTPEKAGTAKLVASFTSDPTIKAEVNITIGDYTEPTVVFSDYGGTFGDFDNIVAGMTNICIGTSLRLPGGSDDWNAELTSITSSDPEIAKIVSNDEYSFTADFLKPGTVTFNATLTSEDNGTVNGSIEVNVSATGEYTSKFDFYNGNWKTDYNFPEETLTDFTAHNTGVDMTISAGKTANITIDNGATIKFAVTDPTLRIVAIKASVHSYYRGSVDLFDKVTCSSGSIGETGDSYNLWQPDEADAATGVEEVTFTATKEFANLVIWTVTLRRFAEQTVTLDKTEEELATNTTLQLTATVGEGALPATLEWSSSDETVATVDENGLVTTHDAYGTAVITVKYGAAEATCTINVTEAAGIEAISTDAAAPAEYYNLQGVRVAADALAPGIYICRQGNTVTKVLVK